MQKLRKGAPGGGVAHDENRQLVGGALLARGRVLHDVVAAQVVVVHAEAALRHVQRRERLQVWKRTDTCLTASQDAEAWSTGFKGVRIAPEQSGTSLESSGSCESGSRLAF